MKRQNIRKLMLIIALLLFPVVIYYLSPYLIIQGALEGVISGSFIVFLCMLIGSIFFGRLFCGWVCPMGGMQECLTMVRDKPGKQGWRNYIKYVIWVIWISGIILCLILSKKNITIDFFYMTDHGISISEIQHYVIYYLVIFLVLIPAIIGGRRAFCHYFCWMAVFMALGTKIRQLLHFPGFHIDSRKENCISCKKCNKACPMGLDVAGMVNKEKSFGTECIQCGACVDGCPKNVLSYSFKKEKK